MTVLLMIKIGFMHKTPHTVRITPFYTFKPLTRSYDRKHDRCDSYSQRGNPGSLRTPQFSESYPAGYRHHRGTRDTQKVYLHREGFVICDLDASDSDESRVPSRHGRPKMVIALLDIVIMTILLGVVKITVLDILMPALKQGHLLLVVISSHQSRMMTMAALLMEVRLLSAVGKGVLLGCTTSSIHQTQSDFETGRLGVCQQERQEISILVAIFRSA